MNVKILGTGCPRCQALERKVRNLAAAHQIPLQIEKIMDPDEITTYGIMITPGLVIDGEVKSSGTIPGKKDLLRWFQEDRG